VVVEEEEVEEEEEEVEEGAHNNPLMLPGISSYSDADIPEQAEVQGEQGVPAVQVVPVRREDLAVLAHLVHLELQDYPPCRLVPVVLVDQGAPAGRERDRRWVVGGEVVTAE
jgi:hypothetical protein